MILHIPSNTDPKIIEKLAQYYEAAIINDKNKIVLIASASIKSIDDTHKNLVTEQFVFSDDIQLASRAYIQSTREIRIGDMLIGGSSGNTMMMAGPCGVESEELIEKSASLLNELGVKTLRAGSYKPRTSPYSYQGMGLDGLKLLAKMREKYGFNIVTEVRDSTHIEEIIEYADIVQIGAKAMYDHGILRRCGKANKPILLKRGFGTTLQEFVQAAEFILSGGNANVMLCERGIRTFETKSRFTLDLCGVAFLKEYTNLPVILDPSHAMGYAYGVSDLARACMAMGVDGLLIEVHPNPSIAKSDASQQLNHDEFKTLFASLKPIASAIGRQLI